MRVFIAACLVASMIAVGAAVVLDRFVQESSSAAFTEPMPEFRVTTGTVVAHFPQICAGSPWDRPRYCSADATNGTLRKPQNRR